jgi:hypothetical protein
MMELESGEYGNFDFEEESLRHQIVMHGLTCLVNRKVFRRRILKKTEDEVCPLSILTICAAICLLFVPYGLYLLCFKVVFASPK